MVGKIFLIIYKLKRKKKTFEFNPPASETSEHLLPFSDISVLLSLSLSLLQVILGHMSVTDSRERWEGGKKQTNKLGSQYISIYSRRLQMRLGSTCVATTCLTR